jgi:hypothetical protein
MTCASVSTSLLGALGFQRLEPLVHRLEVVAQPHTAHAGGGNRQPALPQFVGHAQLPECRLLERERNDRVFDLLSYAVLQHRLLAADLLQRQLAACIVKLLEAVEAVAAVAHHLAGLADIAELFGELQQPDFRPDDLLFGRRGVLQCAEAGRFATDRSAPRLGSRFAVGIQDTSVRLSFSFCNGPGEVNPPSDRHVASFLLLFVVGVLPLHHAIRGAGEPI